MSFSGSYLQYFLLMLPRKVRVVQYAPSTHTAATKARFPMFVATENSRITTELQRCNTTAWLIAKGGKRNKQIRDLINHLVLYLEDGDSNMFESTYKIFHWWPDVHIGVWYYYVSGDWYELSPTLYYEYKKSIRSYLYSTASKCPRSELSTGTAATVGVEWDVPMFLTAKEKKTQNKSTIVSRDFKKQPWFLQWDFNLSWFEWSLCKHKERQWLGEIEEK